MSTFRHFKLGTFRDVDITATSTNDQVKLFFRSPMLVTATEAVSIDALRKAVEQFIANASHFDNCSIEPQIYYFNGCVEFDFGRSFVAIPCDSQDVPPLYAVLKDFLADYEKAA